jgi:radical SAM superfamily enzyme YgiQ (UPF0313 family)
MSIGLFIMGFPEDTNETLKSTYDMMDELQLDKVSVGTLMPHPGTNLFNQVVKNKLFIHNWNLDELWKTPISQSQGEFIIKPFNISLDDLYKWREKFDKMLIKYWKTNPNPATLERKLAFDSAGRAPRVTYRKKNSPLIYESIEKKSAN